MPMQMENITTFYKYYTFYFTLSLTPVSYSLCYLSPSDGQLVLFNTKSFTFGYL